MSCNVDGIDLDNPEGGKKAAVRDLLLLPEDNLQDFEVSGESESEDGLHESDHNSNTEDDCSDCVADSDHDINGGVTSFIFGKDKLTKWNKLPPNSCTRTRKESTITCLPGVKIGGINAHTPLEAWQLYFPEEILKKIVNYTNRYVELQRNNFGRERDCKDTTMTEMKAFLGVLYLAGVMRASHQNLGDLWNDDGTGVDIFQCAMSLSRFRFLLKCVCFDDITTRAERKEFDKLAPIREIFTDFIMACQNYYTPSEYLTVDEMLEGYRGKCSFRQYIPSKPARYGIKIFALVDACTYYTCNLEVYVGKQPEGPFSISNSPQDIVKRMTEPIKGTGRNITMDNWFSSVSLAENLLQFSRLTMVGTIRKNKKELSSCIVNANKRKVFTSEFAFTDKLTTVSYVPRKNKCVILLSSMHHDNAIDNSRDKKRPEIFEFYNMTKGGVGVVDEMKGTYSVARRSNRWPLTVFFAIMNIAGINSHIIYQTNSGNKIPRRLYLKQLAMDLMKSHMQCRGQNYYLPRILSQKIRKVLGEPEEKRIRAEGRCTYCSCKKNRKTKKKCQRCEVYICAEHCYMMCIKCANENVNYESE